MKLVVALNAQYVPMKPFYLFSRLTRYRVVPSAMASQNTADIGVHALVDDVERRVPRGWYLAPMCLSCAELPVGGDVLGAIDSIYIDARVILIPILEEFEGTPSLHRGANSTYPRAC